MRELNMTALWHMEGQQVLVKDLTGEAYDQICTVEIEKTYVSVGKKLQEIPNKLKFSNEEFTFVYDITTHQCENGEFKVYTRN